MCGATWKEIDLEGRLWTIPAERMKGNRMHRVPLSDAALVVLAEIAPPHANPDAPVFPARTGRALSNTALIRLLHDLDAASINAGGDGWRDEHGETVTPHGFRSSFRDWCGDTGHLRELAEAALAHTFGNEVEPATRGRTCWRGVAR